MTPFNFIPYGEGSSWDWSFPAIWIVANCFCNVVHIDDADKTKWTFALWWQAYLQKSMQEFALATQEKDKGMVKGGAFLITSLGVGIDLEAYVNHILVWR
jgi:hypothetical protein